MYGLGIPADLERFLAEPDLVERGRLTPWATAHAPSRGWIAPASRVRAGASPTGHRGSSAGDPGSVFEYFQGLHPLPLALPR